MKISIRTKLLFMCVFLVFLTAAGVSITYYVLGKQDKQRESRQRMQIAFDIILDDISERLDSYSRLLVEFLQRDSTPGWSTDGYNKQHDALSSWQFVISYLGPLDDDLKNLGYLSRLDHLALYTLDGRLLLFYHREGKQDSVGAYLISESGQDTYYPLGDSSGLSTMMLSDAAIPDNPLPEGIAPFYEGEIPEKVTSGLVQHGQQLIFQVVAPVRRGDEITGSLVGEAVITEEDVQHYASLSKTEVTLFSGAQRSVGTLASYDVLAPSLLSQANSCDSIREAANDDLLTLHSVTFDGEQYHQGHCVLADVAGKAIGAISVSLSQEFEAQEVKQLATAAFLISGLAIAFGAVLAILFSRRTVRAIQNIVDVIGSASAGDLRQTTHVASHDEFGMLAQKLNQMITQLRKLSGQVQDSSRSVGVTADAILQEIETLTTRIEQQSTSVDNTTDSVKRINQFINTIGDDTTELLTAAEQILSSVHEARTSREEVNYSIGMLAGNLHVILASVEQVSSSAKQMTDNVGQLDEVTRQTGTEIQHIDRSFKNVSENAELSLQLARETKDAALSGQESVDASIQGMGELKEAVSRAADIIQEVSSWSEQVNSILDIVDDITEQTSLLALNASIISAQAGSHGRGFAVVADEIKELANRTRNSTQEIATLLNSLQQKTREGVQHTAEGLKKADLGMQLANTVKESLDTVLSRATRSSDRAANTARVIQDTVDSSRIISQSIGSVTDMVTQIRKAIQEQKLDISQVVEAVESSQSMSEQINHAGLEQNQSSRQIEQSMQLMTEKLSNISHQTEQLTRNSEQIVEAMHAIENIAENILQEITVISGKTANDLVNQSEVLQDIVRVFKVS